MLLTLEQNRRLNARSDRIELLHQRYEYTHGCCNEKQQGSHWDEELPLDASFLE